MTKAELRDFVNTLLGDRAIDETLFDILIDQKKNEVENDRDWMILRSEDESISIGPSTTYLTANSLPTGFKRARRVVWEDSNGNEALVITEIPISQKLHYKDIEGYYYIDYSTNEIFFTGAQRTNTYTVHLYYIRESSAVNDEDESWEFPSWSHPLLGWMIAATEKMRDYDEINMANARFYLGEANKLLNDLIQWDAKLQVSSNQF